MWANASLLDQFAQLDMHNRFETVLQVGSTTVLPYQHGLDILSVTTYDGARSIIVPLGPENYRVSDGRVELIDFPNGTPYTVSYRASPAWVAWSPAGALPHARPFGAGTVELPVRFKLQWLDLWLRRRG